MSTAINEATAFAESAVQMLIDGQPQAAERQCRKALQISPDHLLALSALGQALHTQNQFAEAETIFSRLSVLQPGEPLHWMNLGTTRRCLSRLDDALLAFAHAAARGAAGADFYYNVALTHIERNDYESARALLAKAFAIAPDDAEIRFRYAWCCYECLQTDEALNALAGWDTGAVANAAVAADVGHLLMKLGEANRAEPAVRTAILANEGDVRSRLTLVQVLERTNRLAEASRLLAELADDPKSAALGSDLTLMQAQIAQRNSQHDLAIELFQKVLAQHGEFHNLHFQQYPLAKSLDAAGRYDEAYEVLVAAHQSQTAYLKLSAPGIVLRGAPTLTIADFSCDESDVSRWDESGAPSKENSPVFIVAFPRSGTTLLELALDAHPLLASMDEQPFLQNALDDVLAEGVRYPAQLAQLTPSQAANVRANYWARAQRKVTLASGQRLVDKNPLNLLRLPLIKRLFPNAAILLAIRHPCDVILSCFMQHFRAPDFALLCSDLPTLAAGYKRAFDFWYAQHALVKPNSMEVRYESFVASFDSQIKSVIDFLELPWDNAVLTPGARALEKRFISTPSYSQVVKPVNRNSIDRWRGYERHFAPVLPIVKPYLERWNYGI